MSEAYSDWIGRTEEAEEVITPRHAQQAAATLDHDADAIAALGEGSVLPPLWIWLAFAPVAPMDRIGPDGHPLRGGFLPPVPLERRMWAGGRVTFHDTLRVGEVIRKQSEILKVSEKSGSAGNMVFVTVGHRYSSARGLAVSEEQDIVYIAMPDRFVAPAATPAPETPDWEEEVTLDTVRLFRYSAITFNAHRIHFDLPYATGVEKYPGLVVQGPMQAILLMQAACRRAGRVQPAGFSYRGVHPMFHFDRLRLIGVTEPDGAVSVCTANDAGTVCMKGRLTW